MSPLKWSSFTLLLFLCKASRIPSLRRTTEKELLPCLNLERHGSLEWHHYRGFCYSITDNTSHSWEEANNSCNNSGSLLASVHSMDELNFLLDTMNWTTVTFWIGLRAEGLDSSYEWADGTPVDFANLKNGYSDEQRIYIETCVYLDPSTGRFGRGHCSEKRFYICKVKDNSDDLQNTLPTATTIVSLESCPDGWHIFGAKCYGMFGMNELNKETWTIANQKCMKMEATLVSIHSKEEQDFVSLIMTEKTDMTWIGLFELESSGDRAFQWSDGSPVDFLNWDLGQPNNWDNFKEQCVNIRFVSPHFGKWNDARCDDDNLRQAYICQKHTDPNHEKFPQDSICEKPEGWIKLSSSCYKIFSESEKSTSWSHAQLLCSKFGGNLVSVRDARVNSFISLHLEGLRGYFWIGMRNEGRFKTYSWISGPADYSNWLRGQPRELSNQPNCVATDPYGRWVVSACDENHPFICEVTEGTAAPTTQEPVMGMNCPNNSLKWTDYGGDFCYIIEMKDQVTWYEASHRCFQEGGYLVSFHSLEEVNVAVDQVKSYGLPMHIGLGQTHSGGYGWVDRSAVDFVNWEPGKPNSQSQKCVAMSSRNGKWNDVSCENRRGYICSISKISTNGNPEYTKEKKSHEESVSKLGAGGIVGIVLCVLVITTIAVATYCYLYPSMRSVVRLTESRPV